MKITVADEWFSKCIRERASWTCERCGTHYTPPTQGLHCSHFVGRANWATRYMPLDAFAHCYGCHSYFHQNPDEFREWVKKTLGICLYDVLQERKRDSMRGKEARHSVKEIAAWYKSEYERLMSIRTEGITGRLEISEW